VTKSLAPWLFAAFALGCAGNEPSQIGTGEPFVVKDAQFIKGKLPGSPSIDGGQRAPAEGGAIGLPRITSKTTTAGFVLQGQSGWSISGEATKNTASVGISLDGVGTGYWVKPVGAVNPATGDLTWAAVCDFTPGIPTGPHEVRVVAIGNQGETGNQVVTPLCVKSSVPDNFHSCRPTRSPPAAEITLSWDSNVDLDLQVLTPAGRLVEAKHPFTEVSDAGDPLPTAGKIDRDSNAACLIDGARTENLTWTDTKPSGRYGIYVNLFDACKQPSVRFEVAVYTAIPGADAGTMKLKKWFSKAGELLDFQANGGSQRGLFVSEFDF
jgi:hypothetical protein